MQILFCTHLYVPTNVYHDWENRSRKEGLMKKQKWCTTGDKYPEAWTRIFMKTSCNWLKTTLKRDAGSNLNNCQCWQEVKGILLSVSGRPRLIYWTHRFDDLALISPRFSSLATFGLLFVVTFNCHKQEAELIHTLVCRADYTAFGLVNNFYFFLKQLSQRQQSHWHLLVTEEPKVSSWLQRLCKGKHLLLACVIIFSALLKTDALYVINKVENIKFIFIILLFYF